MGGGLGGIGRGEVKQGTGEVGNKREWVEEDKSGTEEWGTEEWGTVQLG